MCERDALEFAVTRERRTLVYSWCGRLPSCFVLRMHCEYEWGMMYESIVDVLVAI